MMLWAIPRSFEFCGDDLWLRVVRVIWNEKWEPDLIHNIKEVRLGLEFTLMRWDDIHSFIHSSIHPSRRAKRIVQLSSLCLVENKLEGKAFIHSFTLPFIHPSSIHPFGRPKDIPSAKGHRLGPPVLQSTLCCCYVTSYTIATIM